jgi:hypothetical protein
LAFLGPLDAIGLAEADIDAGALQAAFYGSIPGDPLDRYEFAILNALVDDAGAVDGIFEKPIATIRHVQHLAQTSAESDAECYRKWLKGLVAAHRRRPAAPAPATAPAIEAHAEAKAAHCPLHSIVQENVRPKPLDLDTLLAQLDYAVSAPVSVLEPVAMIEPAPAPEPDPVPDDAPLDGVSFEEAQAFIMSALAAEGYLASDLDLDAVERAADGDENAMTDPLGAYSRAQQAGAEV